VLRRAGYRCQAVENGARCDVTGAENLHAHHITGLRVGGTNDPANGVALCRPHHGRVEAASAVL
jgi:predicted restriction endonuclease